MKTRRVQISSKWMFNKFCCCPDFITETCRGSCCERSGKAALISLLPQEQIWFEKKKYKVENGILQPDQNTQKCPVKTDDGFCGLHNTKHKPFGCRCSPFTLRNGKTLIVRQRYSVMRCHGLGDYAFRTFRSSLNLIFGNKEAEHICNHLEKTHSDVIAEMPIISYTNLIYLDSLKQEKTNKRETLL